MIRRLRNSSGLALHHILYAIVAVGLAVVVVMWLDRRGGGTVNEEADSQAQPAAAAADPTLMDPTPYRVTIQQIETILYQDGPSGLADASQVSRLAVQLGTQLLRAPNRLQGQRAGREVMAFSNRIGQLEDVGSATLNLPAARKDWEEVRGKVFVAAAWFRSTAP